MKTSYSFYDLEGPEEGNRIQSKKSIQNKDSYSAEIEEQTMILKQNKQEFDFVHHSGSLTKAFDITPFSDNQHRISSGTNRKGAETGSETYEQLLANENFNLGKKPRHDEEKKTLKSQVISMEEKAKYMDMSYHGGAQYKQEVKYLVETEVPETLEEYAKRLRDKRRAKKEARLQRKLEREGKLKTPDVKSMDFSKRGRNVAAEDSGKRSSARKSNQETTVEKSKKGHEISEERIEGSLNDNESMDIMPKDGKNSRLNMTIISPPSSSESESEDFLKFDEETPSKNTRRAEKLSSAKSKSSWRGLPLLLNEEQQQHPAPPQLLTAKLIFSLDSEPLSWNTSQDKMEEENNHQLPTSQNKSSKSKASTTKKLTVSKEHVSECEKNLYRVLGHDRIFYSHDTNMVKKLNDYLIKQTDTVEDEAIEEEKDQETEEFDEYYKFESRYFMENPTKVCHRCHRAGHFEKMCPDEAVIRCLFCCRTHHTSHCKSIICFRCNNQGHKTQDCKSVGAQPCFKCNKKGHRQHECGVLISLIHSLEGSTKEKNANQSLVRCFNCNQFGHANCNRKGALSGSQRKVDDLYNEREWKRMDKELEEEIYGESLEEEHLEEEAEDEEEEESESEYELNTFLKSSEESGEDFDEDIYSSNRKIFKRKGGNKYSKHSKQPHQREWSSHRKDNRRHYRDDRIHHSSKKIHKTRLNDSAFHRRKTNNRKRRF